MTNPRKRGVVLQTLAPILLVAILSLLIVLTVARCW